MKDQELEKTKARIAISLFKSLKHAGIVNTDSFIYSTGEKVKIEIELDDIRFPEQTTTYLISLPSVPESLSLLGESELDKIPSALQD